LFPASGGPRVTRVWWWWLLEEVELLADAPQGLCARLREYGSGFGLVVEDEGSRVAGGVFGTLLGPERTRAPLVGGEAPVKGVGVVLAPGLPGGHTASRWTWLVSRCGGSRVVV
jgi:hypothetical protein